MNTYLDLEALSYDFSLIDGLDLSPLPCTCARALARKYPDDGTQGLTSTQLVLGTERALPFYVHETFLNRTRGEKVQLHIKPLNV